DWKKMSASITRMNEIMGGYAAALQRGEQPDRAVVQEVGALNQDLLGYAGQIMGKIKTHLPLGNGEFTHPVNLALIVKTKLEEAGQPLSTTQNSLLMSFGEAYVAEYN